MPLWDFAQPGVIVRQFPIGAHPRYDAPANWSGGRFGYAKLMPDSTPEKKPPCRLSPEWRRALEMLATSESSGATEAIMLAHGFLAAQLAGMARDGLVTEAISTTRAGTRRLHVRRLSITEDGRRALAEATRRRPSTK